jgi:HK97 family phage prohead protease
MRRKTPIARFRSMVPAAIQPISIVRSEGKPTVVRGYGAVFHRADNPGTEYWLYNDLVERVGRGAFDRALSEKDDVRALFNHDVNQIMGRSSAGTLRLSVDDVGLRYEFDLPSSPNGENLAQALERKDVTGSSFSFDLLRVEYREESDFFVREMLDVRLFDVGPVTFPAYTAATAGLRSAWKPTKGAKRSEGFDDRLEARAELREWLESLGPSPDEVEMELTLARAKMRMRVKR